MQSLSGSIDRDRAKVRHACDRADGREFRRGVDDVVVPLRSRISKTSSLSIRSSYGKSPDRIGHISIRKRRRACRWARQ